MPMITLIIESLGTRQEHRVEVQENALVGTCVAWLVEAWGYPRKDTTGRPVVYQLRPSSSTRPLLNSVRFVDAHVRSETRFVLEAEGANRPTGPVAIPGACATKPAPARVLWRRRSRRSLLLTLVFTGFSVTGLSTGLATALARAHLAGRMVRDDEPPSPPSRSPVTVLLRGANVQVSFSSHQQTVRVVGWSPDGTLLASGGDDAQLLIWEPGGRVRQRVPHAAPVLALSWSPESQRIVTGAANQVTYLEALTGNRLTGPTSSHAADVTSLAWTPNNQMQVVSGALDKRAIVWETTHYQPQTVFARHSSPIQAVSWAADGSTVASASDGGAVRIWNAATVQETHGYYQDARVPMRACAFAPRGASLAVGGDDGVIRVWNGLLCQQQATGNDGLACQDTPQRLTTTNTPIRSLAWSSDARYLASGSNDGSLAVWSLAQRTIPLFTVTIAAGRPVHSLAWSPDNSQIATASGNSVILWNLHA